MISYNAMLKATFNGAEKYLAENCSSQFFQPDNFNYGQYKIFSLQTILLSLPAFVNQVSERS